MRKFTATEIDLCKKIAEKERGMPEYGQWYYQELSNGKKGCFVYADPVGVYLPQGIPLWQEHDCLEWLREKGWSIYDMAWICEPRLRISYVKPKEESKTHEIRDGETLLECLLRAVLAVMEGK